MLVFARPLRPSHSVLHTLFSSVFFLLLFRSIFFFCPRVRMSVRMSACAIAISTWKIVELIGNWKGH